MNAHHAICRAAMAAGATALVLGIAAAPPANADTAPELTAVMNEYFTFHADPMLDGIVNNYLSALAASGVHVETHQEIELNLLAGWLACTLDKNGEPPPAGDKSLPAAKSSRLCGAFEKVAANQRELAAENAAGPSVSSGSGPIYLAPQDPSVAAILAPGNDDDRDGIGANVDSDPDRFNPYDDDNQGG